MKHVDAVVAKACKDDLTLPVSAPSWVVFGAEEHGGLGIPSMACAQREVILTETLIELR